MTRGAMGGYELGIWIRENVPAHMSVVREDFVESGKIARLDDGSIQQLFDAFLTPFYPHGDRAPVDTVLEFFSFFPQRKRILNYSNMDKIPLQIYLALEAIRAGELRLASCLLHGDEKHGISPAAAGGYNVECNPYEALDVYELYEIADVAADALAEIEADEAETDEYTWLSYLWKTHYSEYFYSFRGDCEEFEGWDSWPNNDLARLLFGGGFNKKFEFFLNNFRHILPHDCMTAGKIIPRGPYINNFHKLVHCTFARVYTPERNFCMTEFLQQCREVIALTNTKTYEST